MGFSIQTSIPAITVFFQGLLSFFSPCVLPLVPLYVSYLAGGAKKVEADGTIRYPRGKVMLNTLFFVIGVSFTFFLLGLGFTTLGRFFSNNRYWFVKISGIIMVLFGLYQIGALGHSNAIEREHRLPFRLDRFSMNPLTAWVLGFTFSFAWTPCVGPTMSSVLLMASSAGTSTAGFTLIGVYTIGFVLPFLAVGLFTGAVLGFFKKHQSVVRYTVKIGGILLILMGIMTFTGLMNGFTSYLSSGGGAVSPNTQNEGTAVPGSSQESESEEASAGSVEETAESKESQTAAESEEETETDPQYPPAPDFTLVDQYGETHTLSDYKGKTVFLNFWATWCPPCKKEMPDIQKLYEKYGENSGDLVVLGVANPKDEDHPYSNDVPADEVAQFLKNNKYTFPVVMDASGDVLSQYGIMSFPTTFMIDKEGNVFGYVSGALTQDIMESIVKQTMEGKRAQ